jgi:two-component system nitrogen regulation sensor histidine kinase GlnL
MESNIRILNAPNVCNIDSIMTIAPAKSVQVLDNINTAVLVFDSGLRLTDINTAGENLLSVSQRMVQGQLSRDILPDSPGFTETLERTFANRHPYTQWGVELRLTNGESVTVGCMVTPLLEGEQCSEVIVEFIESGSFARVMREQNLFAVHDAASKSLRGMAHEIKNPLGGLRGAAQLLERELENEDLKEYTRIIISEADRLRNLVDRMLEPSSEMHITRINIHEILEYVQDLVQAGASKHLDISRDYDTSLPLTRGDREQLIQAFLNVIRNAVEAVSDCEDGRIWLRTRVKRKCTIRQKQFRLAALIEVIDNGPGIPAEIESEVFYPLITGRAGGSGLGLSITQSLLQKHGGSIDYERINDRTVFRILLPLSKADDRE